MPEVASERRVAELEEQLATVRAQVRREAARAKRMQSSLMFSVFFARRPLSKRSSLSQVFFLSLLTYTASTPG